MHTIERLTPSPVIPRFSERAAVRPLDPRDLLEIKDDLAASVSVSAQGASFTNALNLFEDCELREVARRLRQLRNACGCREAAAGMFVGLALAICIVARHGVSGIAEILWAAGIVTALVVSGVLVGKLIGMGVARLRWVTQRQRAVERILNRAKRSDHGILR